MQMINALVRQRKKNFLQKRQALFSSWKF